MISRLTTRPSGLTTRRISASVAAKSRRSQRPSENAGALPTGTGTTEVASVRGRAASGQACHRGIDADIGKIVTCFFSVE
jgi:hypothetical protein